MMKEKHRAGPAYFAAATPVMTKIPAPTMVAMASVIKSMRLSDGWSVFFLISLTGFRWVSAAQKAEDDEKEDDMFYF